MELTEDYPVDETNQLLSNEETDLNIDSKFTVSALLLTHSNLKQPILIQFIRKKNSFEGSQFL